MDDCAGPEGERWFRWRSALECQRRGEGPDTLPFPRQLRLTSDAVDLRTAEDHISAVSALLECLDDNNGQSSEQTPDLGWLRLPHPCNTREHAAHLCEYVTTLLSIVTSVLRSKLFSCHVCEVVSLLM